MSLLFIGLQSFTMRVHEFSAETDVTDLRPLVFCQVQDSVIYRSIAEELKAQISQLSNNKNQDIKTPTQGFENPEQIHAIFNEFRQLIGNIYQISVEKENRKISDTFVANKLLEMGEDIRELKTTIAMIPERNKQNTTTEQGDRLLKAAEVQKILGISKATLHVMRNKGQIPATPIGSQYKYNWNDVQRLLKTRKQKPEK
jgi:predicted DNA-binding transcriptional regulator AlpA